MQIILASWNEGKPTPVFNNAAQVWNHTFFWEGMAPKAGGAPSGKLADAINASFGSYDEFKKQFSAAGATQFGSGWAWLIVDKGGKLTIEKTANAVCPLVTGALRRWQWWLAGPQMFLFYGH
jgi:superoxide dismutase, Fe-Mn family